MYHLGGMTMGYLEPPVRVEKSARAEKSRLRHENERLADDEDRDRDLVRGFLTPWHLFY